jgi:AhpD family alkylhydroperoxidase
VRSKQVATRVDNNYGKHMETVMATSKSLSHSDYLAKTGLYNKWAPGPLAAFQNLAKATFADGVLSNADKELIAVGCAHVLRCAYCIDYHVGLAAGAGASKQEMSEAIWVGVAMAAGACFAHAAIGLRTMDGAEGDYYAQGDESVLAQLAQANPQAYGGYAELNQAAFAEGTLSARLKRLIAIACAHNTRCPHCIDHHVGAALGAGEDKHAIAEAIWVAIGHAGLAAALMEEDINANNDGTTD